MSGTALVISQPELDDLAQLGHALRDSGYFTDVGSVAQAAVKVLAGRELGLGPVAAMRSLHIVEGKIELSADLLAQRVKLHPRYDYRVVRLDAEACVLRFFEAGAPVGVSEFTMGDAANAKLLARKSQTWERYPRNMLFNRALTNGVAWFCPDVAGGGTYIVEGGITVDPGTGEILEAAESLEAALPVEPVVNSSGGQSEPSSTDGKADEDEAGGVVVEDATPPASDVDPEARENVDGAIAASDEGGEPVVSREGTAPASPSLPPDSRDEQATMDFYHPGKKHIMVESDTSPGAKFCRRGRVDGKGGDPCDYIDWGNA